MTRPASSALALLGAVGLGAACLTVVSALLVLPVPAAARVVTPARSGVVVSVQAVVLPDAGAPTQDEIVQVTALDSRGTVLARASVASGTSFRLRFWAPGPRGFVLTATSRNGQPYIVFIEDVVIIGQ